MNRESLEKLLIDRQFGELSPEVGELLDAWLSAEPKDRELAAGMEALITRMRQSDRAATASALPPFPLERIKQSLQAPTGPFSRERLRPSLLRPIALAAAIGVAFLIGSSMNRSPVSLPSQQMEFLASRPEDLPQKSDFWSISRFSSGRTDRMVTNKQNIKWATPLAWPKTGDAS